MVVNGQAQLAAIRGGMYGQARRQAAFARAHPGTEFTPRPVGGLLLAWVPFGNGKSGVQFSGGCLRELLDEAERFFREAELDSG